MKDLKVEKYNESDLVTAVEAMEYYKVSINERNGDFEYDIDCVVKCKEGKCDETMHELWINWRGGEERDIDENGELWSGSTSIGYPSTTKISHADFVVLEKYLSTVGASCS